MIEKLVHVVMWTLIGLAIWAALVLGLKTAGWAQVRDDWQWLVGGTIGLLLYAPILLSGLGSLAAVAAKALEDR